MLTMTRTKPAAYPRTQKSVLATMEPFKNLSPLALKDLESQVIEKKYEKRESIFLEDDRADYIWFVKEGHVKEVHHLPDGRDITLCMVGADGMFGISAFNGGEYGFHSVAETDVTVLSFPIRAFQALMSKFPEVAKAVLSKISKLLSQSKETQTFSQESAERRLLHVLVEMVGEFGDTVPLTRREIAEMAGTAVETAIRTFTRLENEGFIKSVPGKIIVKKLDALKHRFGEF